MLQIDRVYLDTLTRSFSHVVQITTAVAFGIYFSFINLVFILLSLSQFYIICICDE